MKFKLANYDDLGAILMFSDNGLIKHAATLYNSIYRHFDSDDYEANAKKTIMWITKFFGGTNAIGGINYGSRVLISYNVQHGVIPAIVNNAIRYDIKLSRDLKLGLTDTWKRYKHFCDVKVIFNQGINNDDDTSLTSILKFWQTLDDNIEDIEVDSSNINIEQHLASMLDSIARYAGTGSKDENYGIRLFAADE